MSNKIKAISPSLVRRPMMSLNWILDLLKGNKIEVFYEAFKNNVILQEAIYLGSYSLYNAVVEAIESNSTSENLGLSLVKYFTRMATRSTPFGLFAGCGVVPLETSDVAFSFNSEATYSRQTSLDMLYLNSLCSKLSSIASVKYSMLYFPNNSIYEIGAQYRYVESFIKNDNVKLHNLSAIDKSEVIDFILTQSEEGLTFTQLSKLLFEVLEEVGLEDVEQFVEELIDTQFLEGELELAITGGNLESQFLEQLQTISNRAEDKYQTEIAKFINSFEVVIDYLKQLDEAELGKGIYLYDKIIEELEGFGVKMDKSNLFQANLSIETPKDEVSKQLVDQITEGIELISRLTLDKDFEDDSSAKLTKFIEKFYKRYESQEVPLVLALDKELGINYSAGNDKGGVVSFLDDIVLPLNYSTTEKLHWDREINKFWLRKYESAIANKTHIVIEEKEVEDFPVKVDQTADTFSILATLINVNETEKQQVIFNGGTSVNATRLIGRFCLQNEEIYQLARDIVEKEKTNNPGTENIEICHVPGLRIGNVLRRPKLSEYEIPFLGKSGLDREHQIAITDLMVSYKNGKLLIRSKKLDKFITPRLSNAHNYNNNALPIYQFLCDMQNYYVKNPHFYIELGFLYDYVQYVPRIVYKNIIISRATWVFLKEAYQPLLEVSGDKYFKRFRKFVREQELPRYFCITMGDNYLVVDSQSEISAKIFLKEIKSKPRVFIREYPEMEENTMLKTKECFTNDVFIAFHQTKVNEKPIFPTIETTAKRTFLPGSECLYIKLYTGENTADNILVNEIGGIIKQLQASNLISKWFFIRYGDPDNHIRLRVFLNNVTDFVEVNQTINTQLESLLSANQLYDVQWDTYNRELERYGDDCIEIAEGIFDIDSSHFIQLFNTIGKAEFLEHRWLLSLLTIHEYLVAFDFENMNEKRDYIAKLRSSFAFEFNENRDLIKQLSSKYGKHRKKIQSCFQNENPYSILGEECTMIFDQTKSKIKRSVEQLKASGASREMLEFWLSSFLHMHVNRFFNSMQRLHEYVLYDLLVQSYKEFIARNKYSKVKKKN